jgi:hypothetical protein
MDERELVLEVRHARSLHAAPARLTAETMPRARGSDGCGRNTRDDACWREKRYQSKVLSRNREDPSSTCSGWSSAVCETEFHY